MTVPPRARSPRTRSPRPRSPRAPSGLAAALSLAALLGVAVAGSIAIDLVAIDLLAGNHVHAQPPEDDPQNTAFRAVEGPVQEDVPGGTLMVVAYGIVWLLVFGYVLRMGVLHARTMRDVARLERSVADAVGDRARAGYRTRAVDS